MPSGDIWSFPVAEGGGVAFFRVVLAVEDLGVRPRDPLAFVRDCHLVQISMDRALSPTSFGKERLFIDGTFLGRSSQWKRHHFQLVDRKPVELEEVEFPCWFSDRDTGLFFCRGQLRHKLSRSAVGALVDKWDIRLSPMYAEQLSHDAIPGGDFGSRKRFEDADVRYSNVRDEILRLTKVSISDPYWKAIRDVRGALKVCERALKQ